MPRQQLLFMEPQTEAARRAATAADAAGVWPPRDAALLAAAAAAALRLLSKCHSMRSVLLPGGTGAAAELATSGGGDSVSTSASASSTEPWQQVAGLLGDGWYTKPRLFRELLPTGARQLLAAAAAAMAAAGAVTAAGGASGAGLGQLQAALPALLEAASVSCKLVQLAASDADHWTLLGIHTAAKRVMQAQEEEQIAWRTWQLTQQPP